VDDRAAADEFAQRRRPTSHRARCPLPDRVHREAKAEIAPSGDTVSMSPRAVSCSGSGARLTRELARTPFPLRENSTGRQ
jgi:hypothetical protein